MSSLVNLALLESLKAHDFNDEIDLYIPFLANTILEIEKIPFDIRDVAQAFKDKFGFKPPEAVVKVLLVRAKKRGLVKVEQKQYLPNVEKLKPYRVDYNKNKQILEVSLDNVLNDFVDFVHGKYSRKITKEYSETILLRFIENNVSSLLDSNRLSKFGKDFDIKNEKQLVASYIATQYQGNTRNWQDLQIVLKGVVLANYLFFADKKAKSSNKKIYKNVTVFLDTPLIIALLGYSGRLSQTAMEELLKLLNMLEVNIRIFDKTLQEIEGLFEAWKRDLKRGNADAFNPSTLQLFISKDIDAPRLDTEQALLEKTLSNYNVYVKYGWKVDNNYQCDESGLEGHLQKNRAVNVESKKGIEHDVVCISRVHNSRSGEVINTLSEKFSVFVTPNSSLVKHANRYLSEDIESGIPIVISDTWLTTIFWLKHQDIYSELPVQSLVSNAYATLNRADSVWENFLQRFNRLSDDGTITSDTVESVRYNKNLLKAVNEISVEAGDDFTDETVLDLVREIESSNAKKQAIAVTEAVKKEKEKLNEVNAELNKSNGYISRVRSFIDSGCRIISFMVVTFLACGLVYGAFLGLTGNSIKEVGQNWAMLLSVGIATTINFIGSIWGVNLKTIYQYIWRNLSDYISKRLFREDLEKVEPVFTGDEN